MILRIFFFFYHDENTLNPLNWVISKDPVSSLLILLLTAGVRIIYIISLKGPLTIIHYLKSDHVLQSCYFGIIVYHYLNLQIIRVYSRNKANFSNSINYVYHFLSRYIKLGRVTVG